MNCRGRSFHLWPWVASILVAMTLLMRLIMLGDRPVMHDESMFAYYAYVFFESGSYTHLPILHGPTLMLASGTLFAIFGDSIAVARAFIAVASLVMLAATLALVPRRYRLGFAPLLITSPVLLYYSRFLRDDILFSAVLMVGMAALAVALSRRRRPGLMVRAACAALGMFMFVALAGIMENAAFVYATGATFLLLLAAQRHGWRGWHWWHGWHGWDGRHGRHGNAALRPSPPPTVAASPEGSRPAIPCRQGRWIVGAGSRSAIPCRQGRWIVGAGWSAGFLLGLAYLAFVYGMTLGPSFQDEARRAVAGDAPETLRAIYLKKLDLTASQQAQVTVRLMADSWRNVKESWDYWMGQHEQHRISGTSHYYLPILLTYELPMCLLLVAGLIWDACRRNACRACLPRRRAAVYAAGATTWVALWLLWKLVSANFAPAWLAASERFLHLAPDASALTLGFLITPVLVWSILSLREHRVLAAWMGWWLACSLFQYSSAGEKVPWLAVHIALPLYLTVVWLWAPRLRRLRRLGRPGGTGNGAAVVVVMGVVVAASLLALRNDIPLIGSRSADPAERIVYNHTTPWLHRTLESRAALWNTMQDSVPLKQRRVVMTGDGVWPAVWYLRHFSYQLADDNQKLLTVPEDTDLIIGTPERLAPLREGTQAGRFMAHEGSLRDGWIQTSPSGESGLDLLGSGMAKLWRYYWAREPWTPRSRFPILVLDPVLAAH